MYGLIFIYLLWELFLTDVQTDSKMVISVVVVWYLVGKLLGDILAAV